MGRIDNNKDVLRQVSNSDPGSQCTAQFGSSTHLTWQLSSKLNQVCLEITKLLGFPVLCYISTLLALEVLMDTKLSALLIYQLSFCLHKYVSATQERMRCKIGLMESYEEKKLPF